MTVIRVSEGIGLVVFCVEWLGCGLGVRMRRVA